MCGRGRPHDRRSGDRRYIFIVRGTQTPVLEIANKLEKIGELPRHAWRNTPGKTLGDTMHFLIFLGAFYFLPAIIAAVRHTHNTAGILLLNIFLGWTVVGWFVALLMALFSAPSWANYYHRGW